MVRYVIVNKSPNSQRRAREDRVALMSWRDGTPHVGSRHPLPPPTTGFTGHNLKFALFPFLPAFPSLPPNEELSVCLSLSSLCIAMDGCLSSLPPAFAIAIAPPASSVPGPSSCSRSCFPLFSFTYLARSGCLPRSPANFRFSSSSFPLPSVSHDNHPSTLWSLRIQPSVILQAH